MVTGERAAHVVAFARHAQGRWVVVVAARLYASMKLQVGQPPVGAVWGDTTVHLPLGDAMPMSAAGHGAIYRDVISGREERPVGRELPLAVWLADFPVAVLEE